MDSVYNINSGHKSGSTGLNHVIKLIPSSMDLWYTSSICILRLRWSIGGRGKSKWVK